MISKRILVSALAAFAATAAVAGTTVSAQQGNSNNATYGKAPDGIIFDQGEGTGTNAGCWSNYTDAQNFSDFAPLDPGVAISAIIIFTCEAPVTGTVTFKAVDQSSHTFLYTESGAPSSWTSDGQGGYMVTYTLANPFVVPSGVTMGYGLSGDGFELGQYSVEMPGDGMMSQYSGSAYQFDAQVGDQTFQLVGSSGNSCDVNGDGKYTATDLAAFLKQCHKDGGSDKKCAVGLAKLVKQCGLPRK